VLVEDVEVDEVVVPPPLVVVVVPPPPSVVVVVVFSPSQLMVAIVRTNNDETVRPIARIMSAISHDRRGQTSLLCLKRC